MKLAYLTGEYPRASDTFIQREVAALRDLGHDVLTCSIRTTGAEHLVGPEQREEHARTFKVLDACKRPLRLACAHLRWMARPGRYLKALKLAWDTAPKGLKGRLYNLIYFAEAGVLADELTRQGVQHLHNHIAKASCTVAMLASELSGIPYSFTIHGPDIFFEPHHWRIDAKAARASFVACISDFCRSQLMCFADQSHWDRFHIVHCGVDPDRYTASAHEGQELLFVGRLAAVKGVPVLLEALKDLPTGWHLTVIGDGPDRAALETQAKGLNVDFLGYRSQAEVAEALAQTDVFVLPSFAEGVPVVLMEAMASGVPVVTTQIAGVPELVRPEAGRLVPPGDVDALRAAIHGTLSDEGRRETGAKGAEIVRTEYNITREAAWLSTLFEGYAKGTPPKGKRPKETQT
ncbi:glycosyltransferase family 4 protein [Tropicibacter naphthalenivorans]|uniref:Putative teichuronic acid biosynthesis glycosyltransferase TuaC n=1 Tax=Tropicibacter naphthalenivorans TaxID=441103 RepID=A0A0P1GUT0_9RHOB|nr:glycosyltransferase family 4 protein [Tropicibacter naphthalenivorans]CUH79410.1 Putative teichuronic acid biosynthesis glycosyltransferase TuaC [Tropicibacter naphthalenivorans]SMC72051.1 Glycosyltransferase involved in cell wall bisynthesis [Tropicibacter naphthalenivorans]